MVEENYPHHNEYSSLNIILNFDKLYNNVSCRIKLLARYGNKLKGNHAEGPSAAAIAAAVVNAAAAVIVAMGTLASLDTRIMAEFGE